MITSAEWLNSTRAVGLLAYGTASTCCFVAWMRARSRREDGHLALLLMLIESTLLLDMAFNWRWMLHQLLMDLAQHAHEYAVRRTPQVIVLIVLVVLIGLRAVRRLSRGRGIALALSGAVLSLALWCTEVISLHQVDHVMYHRLGPIMTVSLLWMVACLMTSTGILMASREAMPAHKYV
jgi:hypothetical protein